MSINTGFLRFDSLSAISGAMSPTDTDNAFMDLSGAVSSHSDNPYDALLEACANDPVSLPLYFNNSKQLIIKAEIQIRYKTHRETRNEQQKAKILADDFSGFSIDPILEKLVNPEAYPGYIDPRNCLVFWARPPERIRELVGMLQAQLRDLAPSQSRKSRSLVLAN